MCVTERIVVEELVHGASNNDIMKGDKMTRKIQVWKMKRYGYGWVTTTQSSYTCKMSVPDQKVGIKVAEPNLSPVQTSSKGVILIF